MTAPSYENFAEAKVSVPTTSITINKPAGVVEGDLMVALISLGEYGLTEPAGWTEIYDDLYGDEFLGIYYRTAGGSEPGSYNFSWTGNSEAYGFIMRITGHKVGDPVDVQDDNRDGDDTPWCPTVITTVDDCLILRVFGVVHHNVTVDGGYPAAHTGITVDESSATTGARSGGAAWVVKETAGSTGAATFSLTAGGESWIALTVAIAPATEVNVTVTPSTLEVEATLHAPTIIAEVNVTVMPAALAVAATLHAPTIITEVNVTVTPATLEVAATVHSPTITTDINVTVTPATLEVAAMLHAPTITATRNVTVTPVILEVAATLHAPTIIAATSIDVTVTPATLEVAATLHAPYLVIPYTDIPPFMHKDLIDFYSGGAWLWLVEIDVIDLPSGSVPTRIARNTKDVHYDGHDYDKFNLQIGEQIFSGDGSIPRVTLRVFQDINRRIEDIINETEGALGAAVKLIRVNEKFLDFPVAALEQDYSALATESDSEWVTFTLGVPNPLTQRFPLYMYSSSTCPWATPSLFKEADCQLPLEHEDTSCTGTYEDCYTKGNAVHWGGELGLDPSVIRL